MKEILDKMAFMAILTAFSLAYADEPVEFRLPKMRTTPIIDGRIGSDEWKDAVGGFGFCAYPSDVVGPVPISFFLGRTKDRLFIAARRAVGPAGVGNLIAGRKQAEDVMADDNFEFVFVGDRLAAMPDFMHVIVNAAGDSLADASFNGKKTSWIPKSIKTKSIVEKGVWEFEFSILLSELAFDKTLDDRHAIRICHTFHNVGNRTGYQSSVRPNEDLFFTAQRTIPIAFDDAAPATQLLVGECESSRWRVSMQLTNPTAKPMKLEVWIEGHPADSQPGGIQQVVNLSPRESRMLPVEGPIIGDERVEVFSEVKGVGDGKRFRYRRICWYPNAPAPEWVSDENAGKKVKFNFAYYPSYDKMRLRADVSELKKKVASVHVVLFDAVGAKLGETDVLVNKNAVADKIWDVPDLKAATLRSGNGGYRLNISVPGDDFTDNREFRRDVFEWEGYKGGLSEKIPEPYKPVEYAEDHVRTLLKDHRVDAKTGLWRQVTALGKDILAGPMKLIWENPSNAKQAKSVSESWDVDGVMVWRLELAPGRYGKLRLEIPLKSERAKLFHACEYKLRHNIAGSVPEGRGLVWDSSQLASKNGIIGDYRPYVWIGGPLRGLAVFGENDKGWIVNQSTNEKKAIHCQEIYRDADGTVRLVLNLIQKSCQVSEPRVIRIGFQATPTKPMEENWRSVDIGTLLGTCKNWGSHQSCDSVRPYTGTDEFFRKMGEARQTGKTDEDYIKRAIEECVALGGKDAATQEKLRKNYGIHFRIGMRESASRFRNESKRLVFYTNARGIHLGSPEGNTFCDEWLRTEFCNRPYRYPETDSYGLDPNSTFRDYAAFWWEKMIATGACDYLYWDCVYCSGNTDLVGTDAYRVENGDVQPASGIFNQRAIVRRGAVLQAEHGWIAHRNWVHMTNGAFAPICSFAGVNYDWESLSGDTPLQERYSREYIQAETIGRQFGNKVAVMGYFATKDPESEKLKWLERTGTGACLTHELIWRRVKVWRDAKSKLDKCIGYNVAGTKVWNYWDEDVEFPASISGGKNASLALARDGKAVIVVSDWDNGGAYEMAPNTAILGIPADFRAINLETGEELAVADGKVKFALKKYDYVMVSLSAKGGE